MAMQTAAQPDRNGVAQRGRHAPERGMVSVETAFATLWAGLALLVGGWLMMSMILFGQCQATANAVARQHARHDPVAVARVVADAPAGATVSQVKRDGVIEVVVTATVRFGPWVAYPISARARAVEE